jgi:hypothetical protein
MLFALIHLQFRPTSGPKALLDLVGTLEVAQFSMIEGFVIEDDRSTPICVRIRIDQGDIDPCRGCDFLELQANCCI